MRRNAIQRATLMQRVADQAKFVILEIAQAAVDQLARRRRRATAPVTLLDQRHRQTAAGRVIRGPCAIDTATDDQQIELTSGQCSRVADKRKSGSHEHFWLRKCEPRASRLPWGIERKSVG